MPVSSNQIILRIHNRLAADAALSSLLAGGTGVVNGPRRPVGYTNPSVTVGILTNLVSERPKHHRATVQVVVFGDNLTAEAVKGQPDTYILGAIADRVEDLLHNEAIHVPGVINCQLEIAEKLGPLFDPADPHEHYMALRFRSVFR